MLHRNAVPAFLNEIGGSHGDQDDGVPLGFFRGRSDSQLQLAAAFDHLLDDLVDGERVAWGTVVALDYADQEEVRAFIRRTGVDLPVLLGDARTAADWSVRAFPTYYVVDAEGRIASRSVGYSTWLGMWVRAWLAR